jgi:hypothetical protein
MRWLTFGWVIIINCLYLLVVLLVFAKFGSSPQAVMIAILGLIYVAIEMRGRYQNMAFARAMVELNRQLLAIRGLLRDAQFEAQAQYLLNLETTISKHYEPTLYINVVFLGLISLVCTAVIAFALLG